MNKQQRRLAMTKHIMQEKEATVKDLAEAFNVTEMTIRRDLAALDKNQLVRRTRGGAVANNVVYKEDHYTERSVSNIKEKRQIAAAAINLIEDNDVLLLDSGTTLLELAKLLHLKKNLTVFINDFIQFNVLKNIPDINLHFIGGTVNPNNKSITHGMNTHQFIRNIHVEKAFITSMTVDFVDGLYHSCLEFAATKHEKIKAAEEVILLADHNKFNSKSMFRFASMEDINILVTDQRFKVNNHDIPSDLELIIAQDDEEILE